MTDKIKGAILIILGVLFFALMNSSVKFLGDLPLMQKVFFRNLFAFITALILLIKHKQSLKGKNYTFLVLRSIFGYLGLILNFYAISKLYLADASILQNTNPFFVILFSLIFLKEPFRKHVIPTLFFAFLGAILVIKPQFNYSILPSMAGLGAGIMSGASYCTVRYLSKIESPQTIIFYFAGISTLITLPFLFIGQYIPPTPIQWMGLIFIGICGTVAQFFITNGYRYAPASELSIYNYTQILFTLLLGMIFWSEIPDLLSILGGVLIILAGYINYRNSRQEKIEQSSCENMIQ
jgi:drug/metabolite transporter (DMT)-like permease